LLNPGPGHCASEEHNIGDQVAITSVAAWGREVAQGRIGNVGIAIGSCLLLWWAHHFRVPWVVSQQAHLDVFPGEGRTADQAAHLVYPAVEVHYCGTAGALVQAIDILGDKQVYVPQSLQSGECQVRCIRPGIAYSRPAAQGAGPVAPALVGIGGEFLVGDGFGMAPYAAPVAIGRYPG